MTTSGTQITQPLSSLLKIKRAKRYREAEVKASREKAKLTGTTWRLPNTRFITECWSLKRTAVLTEARIRASQDLEASVSSRNEFGSSLEQESIERSRATIAGEEDS